MVVDPGSGKPAFAGIEPPDLGGVSRLATRCQMPLLRGASGGDAHGGCVQHTVGMREADVRDALVERLRRQHADEQQTRIVHELSLCQAEARIDLAVVNGRLTGWEIKTAADTLVRLPLQEPVYSRVFDRVWLAADARHVDGALGLIPLWWGVVRIGERSGTCTLTQVRPSRMNPDVDLRSLVRLLWRDEVLAELEALGLAEGVERAPRRVLWQRLVDAVPRRASKAQVQRRVRERLRDREGWRADRPRT